MTEHPAEQSLVAYARAAGVLYLVIIVFGLFSEVVVRSSLIVRGDAAATTANILASEGLFRIGFATDSIVFLSDAALAVLLYVVLAPVSKPLALVAAVFRLAQATVLGLNLLNHYAALLLLGGAGYLSAFTADQLHALALLALDTHRHGYDLGLLFFGVHCLILGYLVVRSDSFPGILGVLLESAGVVYLVGSYTLFLLPDLAPRLAPIYVVALIAELAFCGWLLVKGVRLRPQALSGAEPGK
jgi:hypothetical protein